MRRDVELDAHRDELRGGGETADAAVGEAVARDGDLLADVDLRLLMIQRGQHGLLQRLEAAGAFHRVHEDVQIARDVTVGGESARSGRGAADKAGWIGELGRIEEGSLRVDATACEAIAITGDVLERVQPVEAEFEIIREAELSDDRGEQDLARTHIKLGRELLQHAELLRRATGDEFRAAGIDDHECASDDEALRGGGDLSFEAAAAEAAATTTESAATDAAEPATKAGIEAVVAESTAVEVAEAGVVVRAAVVGRIVAGGAAESAVAARIFVVTHDRLLSEAEEGLQIDVVELAGDELRAVRLRIDLGDEFFDALHVAALRGDEQTAGADDGEDDRLWALGRVAAARGCDDGCGGRCGLRTSGLAAHAGHGRCARDRGLGRCGRTSGACGAGALIFQIEQAFEHLRHVLGVGALELDGFLLGGVRAKVDLLDEFEVGADGLRGLGDHERARVRHGDDFAIRMRRDGALQRVRGFFSADVVQLHDVGHDGVGFRQILGLQDHGHVLLLRGGAGFRGDELVERGAGLHEGETVHEQADLDHLLVFRVGEDAGGHDGDGGAFHAAVFEHAALRDAEILVEHLLDAGGVKGDVVFILALAFRRRGHASGDGWLCCGCSRAASGGHGAVVRAGERWRRCAGLVLTGEARWDRVGIRRRHRGIRTDKAGRIHGAWERGAGRRGFAFARSGSRGLRSRDAGDLRVDGETRRKQESREKEPCAVIHDVIRKKGAQFGVEPGRVGRPGAGMSVRRRGGAASGEVPCC